MAAAAALAEVHQAHQWIGFGNEAHRDSICEEAGFELVEAFVMLIPTATPLTVIRRLRLPSSNPSHCHTR